MSVIITGGQSFSDIAAAVTISPEYGPAIAMHNGMEGQDIIGRRFRLEIPDNWMQSELAGKTINMNVTQNKPGGMPGWLPYAVGGLVLAMLLMR